jgi:hypothetical protein
MRRRSRTLLAEALSTGGRHQRAALERQAARTVLDQIEVAASAASESGRSGVTRAVRQAIAQIGAHHPQLGEHLSRALRTGTYCAYAPNPGDRPAWSP